MEKDQSNKEHIDTRRRALLKLAFLGSATFVLAKVLGPLSSLFDSESTSYENFRVVDNGKHLHVYDKKGNELLVVEKDSA